MSLCVVDNQEVCEFGDEKRGRWCGVTKGCSVF